MFGKTILKNLSWLTVQDFIAQFLGILFFSLLAREAGESDVGVYSYIFAVCGFTSYFIDFGIITSYWRKWVNDQTTFQSDVSVILGTKLILLIPTTIFLYIYIFLFDKNIILNFSLVYLYHCLEILRTIPVFFLQAKNDFSKVFLINGVDRFIALGGASISLLFQPSLTLIIIIFIIARLLSILIGLKVTFFTFSFNLNKSIVRETIQSASVLFFIQILTVLYFRVDTLMIKQLLNFEAVGVYSAAYRILESLLVLPNIFLYSIFVPLHLIVKNKAKNVVDRTLNITIKYLALISIFIALFFNFYADDILMLLYGAVFIKSASILKILGLTSIFVYINTPLVSYLLTIKSDKLLLYRALGLTIFNVILNLLFIPLFGVIAAAVATLITECIGFVILLYMSKLTLSKYNIFILILLAFCLYILMLVYHPSLIVGLFFFGLIYILIATILKIISLEDFKK